MTKISEKARQTFIELSQFASNQDVVNALNKAGRNKLLLREAKANPKKYLTNEGIKAPTGATLSISQSRPTVSGQITICFQVCRQLGRVLVCAQICVTIVFQA